MGTLKNKWGPFGDPKTEKGPHGDPGPQMGTHLGAVAMMVILFEAVNKVNIGIEIICDGSGGP